jgi:hypothetical protein
MNPPRHSLRVWPRLWLERHAGWDLCPWPHLVRHRRHCWYVGSDYTTIHYVYDMSGCRCMYCTAIVVCIYCNVHFVSLSTMCHITINSWYRDNICHSSWQSCTGMVWSPLDIIIALCIFRSINTMCQVLRPTPAECTPSTTHQHRYVHTWLDVMHPSNTSSM